MGCGPVLVVVLWGDSNLHWQDTRHPVQLCQDTRHNSAVAAWQSRNRQASSKSEWVWWTKQNQLGGQEKFSATPLSVKWRSAKTWQQSVARLIVQAHSHFPQVPLILHGSCLSKYHMSLLLRTQPKSSTSGFLIPYDLGEAVHYLAPVWYISISLKS